MAFVDEDTAKPGKRAKLTAPRWSISHAQLQKLEEIFKMVQVPSVALSESLAEQMGVNPRQVRSGSRTPLREQLSFCPSCPPPTNAFMALVLLSPLTWYFPPLRWTLVQIAVWFRNRRQRVRLVGTGADIGTTSPPSDDPSAMGGADGSGSGGEPPVMMPIMVSGRPLQSLTPPVKPRVAPYASAIFRPEPRRLSVPQPIGIVRPDPTWAARAEAARAEAAEAMHRAHEVPQLFPTPVQSLSAAPPRGIIRPAPTSKAVTAAVAQVEATGAMHGAHEVPQLFPTPVQSLSAAPPNGIIRPAPVQPQPFLFEAVDLLEDGDPIADWMAEWL